MTTQITSSPQQSSILPDVEQATTSKEVGSPGLGMFLTALAGLGIGLLATSGSSTEPEEIAPPDTTEPQIYKGFTIHRANEMPAKIDTHGITITEGDHKGTWITVCKQWSQPTPDKQVFYLASDKLDPGVRIELTKTTSRNGRAEPALHVQAFVGNTDQEYFDYKDVSWVDIYKTIRLLALCHLGFNLRDDYFEDVVNFITQKLYACSLPEVRDYIPTTRDVDDSPAYKEPTAEYDRPSRE